MQHPEAVAVGDVKQFTPGHLLQSRRRQVDGKTDELADTWDSLLFFNYNDVDVVTTQKCSFLDENVCVV